MTVRPATEIGSCRHAGRRGTFSGVGRRAAADDRSNGL